MPAVPVRGADPAQGLRARTRIAGSCSSRSACRRRRPPTWPPTPRDTSSPYTIGFDGDGAIFRAYKAYGLPTQVFIDPNGVIASIVGAPLDEAGAAAHIEPILPTGGESLTLTWRIASWALERPRTTKVPRPDPPDGFDHAK